MTAVASPADTPVAAKEEEEEQTPAPRPDQDKVHIRYNRQNVCSLQDGRLTFRWDMQYRFSYVLKGDHRHLKHDELGEIFPGGGQTKTRRARTSHTGRSPLRLQDDDGKALEARADTLQIRQDPSIAARRARQGERRRWLHQHVARVPAGGMLLFYGNPCAVPDFCKDWHNRFDVAAQQWKGVPNQQPENA